LWAAPEPDVRGRIKIFFDGVLSTVKKQPDRFSRAVRLFLIILKHNDYLIGIPRTVVVYSATIPRTFLT
jgi:hypothetical protein